MPVYQKIIWIGLAVALIAILALAYFLFLAPASPPKTPAPPEPAALVKQQPAAAPAEADAADPNIVPLDLELEQSDGPVRELVNAADVPASWREWSRQKDLVRMAVAAVDNIAQGLSPAAQLPFLAPAGKFSAIKINGDFFLDPRSFQRYDFLANAFMAVPDKTWITWYRTLRPTLEKAFRELGYPGVTFSERLQQAIEQLSRVPQVKKEIELEKKLLSFSFADPNLENLNPAQKQLLRMGPDNTARIQKKLRALAAGLNRNH
jgi:hypothetical protein